MKRKHPTKRVIPGKFQGRGVKRDKAATVVFDNTLAHL